ncbi:helix-turn-helix domain-containing protein [Aneurinibacillus migulanus]|uniref:Transcriptional regulator n=1 Tax=Aneurinibacillus migulanus TaxID=47500 RepID=A0A0D1W6R6_ANEMI|nr:DNA-binding anti-repressor SinI [Aneurinibacillus migulanus]KIV54120.1 transcriptional regulator [Aneurinibacillus migulanus]KON97608.1 transcriptional regulator [Aneurinibacillus migulanus]MED0896633.1 DNA-binding anti-repressor SinI [Aneurinibacillus migulanus]MED1616012.1 DNA-binding anti-repressor SinI [Aneurinibacillus migulanus]SDK24839.1 Transcriptional regulator, contains XRE-family HTH domain [Aneurinibacillus migulanus]
MLGKRIKQLRTEQKVSLSELAERAGVAKSYLSAIERDIKTNPSIQFLEKIASVLHTSVENLIHPENEQTGEMDPEWRELVKEAMESGVSKQQFREFLEFQIWKASQDDK